MNLPKRIRVYRSLRMARQFITQNKINTLPVDPFKIAVENKWPVISFSQAAKLNIYFDSKKDGDAVYISGKYFIIYNDTKKHFQRLRWTIMHEIGHIYLSHLKDFEETRLPRRGLSDEQYRVLERETDIFTAEVMAPMAILQEVKVHKHELIMFMSDISYSAANNRVNDITWHSHKSIYREAKSYLKLRFKDYLQPITICTNQTDTYLIDICPENTREGGYNIMEKQNYVVTDENNRFMTCPRCGNEEFSDNASYCKICGLFLSNYCNQRQEGFQDDCGVGNLGDARYCESCGTETFLLNFGLLKTWEELLEGNNSIADGLNDKPPKKENEVAASEDPFADDDQPTDISDDDLPF